MRKWSTSTDHTDHGPAVFIKLETEHEVLSTPVLFTRMYKQTYRQRVLGIIEYLDWRASELERIRKERETTE